MSWFTEAVAVSGRVSRMVPRPDRGVLEASEPGVTAVYVPQPERGRLSAALAAAGIEVLGQVSGLVFFVALVRSTDTTRLQEIVRGSAAAE